MKKWLIVILIFFIGALGAFFLVFSKLDSGKRVYFSPPKKTFWQVQSIDTMKYSRDLAGEKLNDASFVQEVERQILAIAKTGATHVAIGTPYDAQFLPYLSLWVDVARKNNLKVWFRGNWSAWEGWFGHEQGMTRQEHIEKTEKFILENPQLFASGDIFSSCPECENGGPGDPRHNGDLAGHRKFIVDEYASAEKAFESIGKNVKANYFSMNGDVARLVMDKETTEKLDGIVVIDHYVKTPEKLVADIADISKQSGGKVVLGEWGVPIPDIHGEMTEEQRVEWMKKALNGILELGDILEGMNYWAAFGGSAAIWEKGKDESETSQILQKYFAPQTVFGRVADELENPISRAKVSFSGKEVFSADDGYFEFHSLENIGALSVSAEGYSERQVEISSRESSEQLEVILEKQDKNLFFKFLLWFKNFGSRRQGMG